jgi:NAD-dependent DNA ligase
MAPKKKPEKDLIARFVKDPHSDFSVDELARIVRALQHAYHNGEALVSDTVYDAVLERLASLDPSNPVLVRVGADVQSSRAKVTLPIYAGSLDKIVTVAKLEQFKKLWLQEAVVVMDKLDGVSALLEATPTTLKLMSRGNGVVGQDISWLIRHVPSLSSYNNDNKQRILLRGELIISKKAFLELGQGSNARSMMSGIVNSNQVPPKARVDYVVYAVIDPPGMTVVEQLAYAAARGFQVVDRACLPGISFDRLVAKLAERKDESPYEVDGIVLASNEYERPVPGRNPSRAAAFKVLPGQQTAVVVVDAVVWSVSKDGYLKPVATFAPVTLAGVSISRATAFNAAFVREGVIGPGAVLRITRAGEVIPHILEVLKPSRSGQAQMPDDVEFKSCGAKDICVVNESAEQRIKTIAHFFSSLSVRDVGEKTVAKMGIRKPSDVFALLESDTKPPVRRELLERMAKAIEQAACMDLMVASNAFGHGFGRRRLEAIVENVGDGLMKLDPSYVPTLAELTAIDGVSDKIAASFLEGLVAWRAFLQANGLKCCFATKEEEKKKEGPLTGKKIVFTGFRDPSLEAKIRAAGGECCNGSVTKGCIVVAKDPEGTSSKLVKARELGVQIVSAQNFSHALFGKSAQKPSQALFGKSAQKPCQEETGGGGGQVVAK